MVPMLAWIARNAPCSVESDLFCGDGIIHKHGLCRPSSLSTKYLNQTYVVTRAVTNRKPVRSRQSADYSQLGYLLISVAVISVIVPLVTVFFRSKLTLPNERMITDFPPLPSRALRCETGTPMFEPPNSGRIAALMATTFTPADSMLAPRSHRSWSRRHKRWRSPLVRATIPRLASGCILLCVESRDAIDQKFNVPSASSSSRKPGTGLRDKSLQTRLDIPNRYSSSPTRDVASAKGIPRS